MFRCSHRKPLSHKHYRSHRASHSNVIEWRITVGTAAIHMQTKQKLVSSSSEIILKKSIRIVFSFLAFICLGRLNGFLNGPEVLRRHEFTNTEERREKTELSQWHPILFPTSCQVQCGQSVCSGTLHCGLRREQTMSNSMDFYVKRLSIEVVILGTRQNAVHAGLTRIEHRTHL